MKRASICATVIAAGMVLWAGEKQYAHAAPQADPAASSADDSQACAHCRPTGRMMYDPNTVQTIEGEVVSIDRMGRRGLHITVQTDRGEIPVHLGPTQYIENQDFSLNRGDRVRVTGSRISFQDQPIIIAREVRSADQTLTLRNQSGVPLWSRGQGMQGMGRPGMGRGMMGQGMRQPGMGRGMMGQGMRQPGMGRGMMGQMPSDQRPDTAGQLGPDDPGAVLANREELDLTLEQVRRLEAIQAEARARANAVLTDEQRQQLSDDQ